MSISCQYVCIQKNPSEPVGSLPKFETVVCKTKYLSPSREGFLLKYSLHFLQCLRNARHLPSAKVPLFLDIYNVLESANVGLTGTFWTLM